MEGIFFNLIKQTHSVLVVHLLLQPPQPGFHIVFDNVNLDIKSRHKTLAKQNKHLDLVHGFAVLDRVNCQDQDNSGPAADILSVPEEVWMVSPE